MPELEHVAECHRLLNAAGIPGNHGTGEALIGRVKQLIDVYSGKVTAYGEASDSVERQLDEIERLRAGLGVIASNPEGGWAAHYAKETLRPADAPAAPPDRSEQQT